MVHSEAFINGCFALIGVAELVVIGFLVNVVYKMIKVARS